MFQASSGMNLPETYYAEITISTLLSWLTRRSVVAQERHLLPTLTCAKTNIIKFAKNIIKFASSVNPLEASFIFSKVRQPRSEIIKANPNADNEITSYDIPDESSRNAELYFISGYLNH
jgi:hypothetical protein